MRDGFAHGKSHLVHIQRAFEHHRNHVHAAGGLFAAKLNHLGQTRLMMIVQLFDAPVQAGEGFAMGGQGQGVNVQGFEFVDGFEKLRQRVRFGLVFMHAHIGGNAWQHHVAANQHFEFCAIQGNVFGRVAISADTAPVTPANVQGVAVLHALEGSREAGHEVEEIIGARPDLRQVFDAGHAVRGKKIRRELAAAKGHGHHRRQPGDTKIGRADPQAAGASRRAPALAQPAGQANVVRVHVGADHPQDRQSFELMVKNLLPLRAGLLA